MAHRTVASAAEISSVGRFEAHVCRKCGHTEMYLADTDALEKLKTE